MFNMQLVVHMLTASASFYLLVLIRGHLVSNTWTRIGGTLLALSAGSVILQCLLFLTGMEPGMRGYSSGSGSGRSALRSLMQPVLMSLASMNPALLSFGTLLLLHSTLTGKWRAQPATGATPLARVVADR